MRTAVDDPAAWTCPTERQPTDEERRALTSWIRSSLEEAARAKEGEKQTVLRRLNKRQYTHALQELLGLDVDFGRVLPDDGRSELGFTNNGEVLLASPLHLEYYQRIARQALEAAIVTGPQIGRASCRERV